MNYITKNIKSMCGEISVPGDKSISHRSIMFGAIAKGITEVDNFLTGNDCLSTISCFRKLGVNIETNNTQIKIYGNGLRGLKETSEVLDVGNSGTTIRLMTGLLAGQKFNTTLNGDASIQKRPMARVTTPLSKMGAKISCKDGNFSPISIEGSPLHGIKYTMPIASAQVKSAILLASLYAYSPTTIMEKEKTRDHSEIMIKYFGGDILCNNTTIISTPVDELFGNKVYVPSDISSAAFFIVAGLIIPKSEVVLKNIGINPTRTGIIDALKEMGGNITIFNERNVSGEKIGDILVKHSELTAIHLKGGIISRMIDEIPVFVIACLFAKGKTIISDAEELKVKESNRISAMVNNLKNLGADIEELPDGMEIQGQKDLHSGTIESFHDHRIAMSFAILGLAIESQITIKDAECATVSFPGFYELLAKFN